MDRESRRGVRKRKGSLRLVRVRERERWGLGGGGGGVILEAIDGVGGGGVDRGFGKL